MDIPTDLPPWRQEQRTVLLARRAASSPADRAAWTSRIIALLETGFPSLRGMAVGFCWPYLGEADVRPLLGQWREQGSRIALPGVVGKRLPLEFREWWPGASMKAGALGIPSPVETPVLVPDAVLIPAVGFCDGGWRLGYGGGYFDRTLAALSPQPLKICIAYELSRIRTIHPQLHDIPMDFVVTEAAIHAVANGSMERIAATECAERAARIFSERGLPRRPA